MRKIGSMQCLEVVQDPDAPWMILFHGFGADAWDLKPLAELIPLNRPCNFLFPQGVLEVPIGPAWSGRAWWNLDLARVQRDLDAGLEWDTSAEVPATLPQVRQKVLAMIEGMKVPWEKIILGGFSQGGMVAVDTALHAPVNPMGLALLSTALINKSDWKEKAPARAGLEFFQCHGQQDMVLSIKNAQRLETLLNQAGLKGSLLSFRGGHEIPTAMLERLGKYLDNKLNRTST
ncbi:MAG: serine esterase [Bdellovibrionaceae bacterium]|nr:serine esterase [Pseudobdellovibrionaceae bacterium]